MTGTQFICETSSGADEHEVSNDGHNPGKVQVLV